MRVQFAKDAIIHPQRIKKILRGAWKRKNTVNGIKSILFIKKQSKGTSPAVVSLRNEDVGTSPHCFFGNKGAGASRPVAPIG